MGKKTRVYELARELGKGSKEILDLLADSGVRDKNHMSALEENVVRFIKNRFAEREGKQSEPSVEAAQAPPAEAKPREAAKPKEKPKPTPVPLPVPRAAQPRGARAGAEHRRTRPASAGSASRPGVAQRPVGDGKARTGGYPSAHDRWDQRWLPGGGVPAGQRPRSGRQWPTQIAPTVPAGRAATPRGNRAPTPAGPAAQRTAAPSRLPGGEVPARGAERRPGALPQRPRQVRPSITPVRPEQLARRAREAQVSAEEKAVTQVTKGAPQTGGEVAKMP
ncbi:MAG: translation initiation factor IF-2 N-terminal domain-containing protein, partial [Bacillota bacterium]